MQRTATIRAAEYRQLRRALEAAVEILEPPPSRTADQWADEYRELPAGSPEPGRWRSSRVPYTIPIYRAFADPRYTTIVGVMGAQMSKALALDTAIPTPSGWTTMGEVKIGDMVFDDRGAQCRVTAKSSVFVDHVCYELTFDNGERVIADAGHRWAVRTNKGADRVLTTEVIAQRAAATTRARSVARVALTAPLVCPTVQLPLDPYVLGAWLGDGSSNDASICVDVRDGVATELEKVMGPLDDRYYDKRAPHIASVHLGRPSRPGAADGARQLLARLGVLNNKHIPPLYKRAAINQRWALLQGLMDTDGCATHTHLITYTSTHQELANDVLELVTSLGIKVTMTERDAKVNGRVVGRCWTMRGTAYQDQPVFRLERKQIHLRDRSDSITRPTQVTYRAIRSVRQVPSVPVQCLSVDSPSHLFLVTRSMLPTHNTELILNLIGQRFSDGPYVPTLYIGPTEKQVRSMSKDRIMKMIRSTDVLWNRLAKGHANKVTEKWIGGVRLGFAWAGSATELASHPAGLVLLDERDRMTSDVNGEGDPVELARARGSNYAGFKMGVFSTPTIEHASATWSLFEEGTMEMWAWPCDHCNAFFIPRLELLRYENTEDYSALRESAIIACPRCGGEHQTHRKNELNANGHYVAHVLDATTGKATAVDTLRSTTTASFWVSGFASPWQTFGQRAEQLAKAYRSREPGRIQGVINTACGELFKQAGEAPPWEAVYETRQPMARNVVPAWSKLVTMGVDVQKRGLYYVVRAWGFNNRSHLIDHGFIHGDTEYDDVWLLWRRILDQGVDGKSIIDIAFVDSGYKPGSDQFRRPEHKVYDVCRRTNGHAFPTKGHDEMDRPIKVSKLDVTSGGRIIKGGVTLWHINTDHVKSWVHAQITPPEGGERLWTTHAEIDEDYCKQIVAEEVVTKPSGKRVWFHGKKANHYFDCEVLSRAAALARQIHTLNAPPPAVTETTGTQPPELQAALDQLPKKTFIQPRVNAPMGQSFFARYRK